MANKNRFIKEYVLAIQEGYAAVFAGAGISQASGYVDWKELVRGFAGDVGLNVDKENDLTAVTQYFSNQHMGKNHVNQAILNKFTERTQEENRNLEILAELPIQTYWTTNYDELIENAIKSKNRKVDIKITQDSLANNIYDRDAVVYKMHGDVRDPTNAVIIKDDYERYSVNRPLFRTALTGDLISKTFLFIGFSFADPNLSFILSQINVLLNKSNRIHYCFFEREREEKHQSSEEFLYAQIKQKLFVSDLKRYGIQAVMLDSYSEITGILEEIEKSCKLKNIFISGSLAKANNPWSKKKAELLAFELSRNLVKKDFKIISGFGLGIGSSVINGALEEIFSTKYRHIDEHLCLRPFPQINSGTESKEARWEDYRNEMIAQAGICIFIFGNKEVEHTIVDADGMLKEFMIAQKLGKIIIPVGSTGGASENIYQIVKSDIANYPYLSKHIDALGTETDNEKLLEIIMDIVTSQLK